MAIGIDDIDDYDGIIEEPVLQQREESDIITDFLKTKGISDPNKIMFEDENNNITERAWNDLSREEQLNILSSTMTVEEPAINNDEQLSEDEWSFIEELRNKNLTVGEYIQQLQNNNEPRYKVDDYSDDELYLADLESRVGNLSEDEAALALASAKNNEDMFKRQIEGIRREYKLREDFQNQQEQAAKELEYEEVRSQILNTVSRAIDNLTSIGNLDLNLEDADKEDLARFLLSQDLNGETFFDKALQEPDTLVKVAWFIINGDEAFNNIEDYFAKLIKKVSEAQYNKGLEDGRKGISRTVVVSKNNTGQEVYKSIDDLP